jgi:hypothetical protein
MVVVNPAIDLGSLKTSIVKMVVLTKMTELFARSRNAAANHTHFGGAILGLY